MRPRRSRSFAWSSGVDDSALSHVSGAADSPRRFIPRSDRHLAGVVRYDGEVLVFGLDLLDRAVRHDADVEVVVVLGHRHLDVLAEPAGDVLFDRRPEIEQSGVRLGGG